MRIAIIAITTSSSISVNPRREREEGETTMTSEDEPRGETHGWVEREKKDCGRECESDTN